MYIHLRRNRAGLLYVDKDDPCSVSLHCTHSYDSMKALLGHFIGACERATHVQLSERPVDAVTSLLSTYKRRNSSDPLDDDDERRQPEIYRKASGTVLVVPPPFGDDQSLKQSCTRARASARPSVMPRAPVSHSSAYSLRSRTFALSSSSSSSSSVRRHNSDTGDEAGSDDANCTGEMTAPRSLATAETTRSNLAPGASSSSSSRACTAYNSSSASSSASSSSTPSFSLSGSPLLVHSQAHAPCENLTLSAAASATLIPPPSTTTTTFSSSSSSSSSSSCPYYYSSASTPSLSSSYSSTCSYPSLPSLTATSSSLSRPAALACPADHCNRNTNNDNHDCNGGRTNNNNNNNNDDDDDSEPTCQLAKRVCHSHINHDQHGELPLPLSAGAASSASVSRPASACAHDDNDDDDDDADTQSLSVAHPSIDSTSPTSTALLQRNTSNSSTSSSSTITTTTTTTMNTHTHSTRSRRSTAAAPRKEAITQSLRSVIDMLTQHTQRPLQVCADGRGGFGVRVMENVSSGQFVCEYTGDIISEEEAEIRENAYAEHNLGCYMFFMSDRKERTICIDATYPASCIHPHARLINHSRAHANLFVRRFTVEGVPRLALFALRDLVCGEELLFDYGDRGHSAMEAFPWLKE